MLAGLREHAGDVSALAGSDDPKIASAVSALAVEPIEGEPTPEYASHVLARLQEFVLKAKSDELRIRLQKLNPQTKRATTSSSTSWWRSTGIPQDPTGTPGRRIARRSVRVGAAAGSVHCPPCSRRSWKTPLSAAREPTTDTQSLDEVKEQLVVLGRERGFVTSGDVFEALPRSHPTRWRTSSRS